MPALSNEWILEITAELKKEEAFHMSNAVIGVVDMVNSTLIANLTSPQIEWRLKVEFHRFAQKHATTTGMEILNQSGDGFMFIANPRGERNWAERLGHFHALLTKDFLQLLTALGAHLAGIQSGLRFGIASGPITLGMIDGKQVGEKSLLISGRSVNLAARLCACAEINGLLSDDHTASFLRRSQRRLQRVRQEKQILKGFHGFVSSWHFKQSIPNDGSDRRELTDLNSTGMNWYETAAA